MEIRLKAEIKRVTNGEAEFAGASEAKAPMWRERERVPGFYRRGVIGDQEVARQARELQGEIESPRSNQERLFGRREALTQLRTRTIAAETLLKSLRKELSGVDEKTKREPMEELVERIVVDTEGEGDLRRAEAAITHLPRSIQLTARGNFDPLSGDDPMAMLSARAENTWTSPAERLGGFPGP